MPDRLKAKNLALAIRRLPEPKTYVPDVVTVIVETYKYTFEKIKKEWHYKF